MTFTSSHDFLLYTSVCVNNRTSYKSRSSFQSTSANLSMAGTGLATSSIPVSIRSKHRMTNFSKNSFDPISTIPTVIALPNFPSSRRVPPLHPVVARQHHARTPLYPGIPWALAHRDPHRRLPV